MSGGVSGSMVASEVRRSPTTKKNSSVISDMLSSVAVKETVFSVSPASKVIVSEIREKSLEPAASVPCGQVMLVPQITEDSPTVTSIAWLDGWLRVSLTMPVSPSVTVGILTVSVGTDCAAAWGNSARSGMRTSRASAARQSQARPAPNRFGDSANCLSGGGRVGRRGHAPSDTSQPAKSSMRQMHLSQPFKSVCAQHTRASADMARIGRHSPDNRTAKVIKQSPARRSATDRRTTGHTSRWRSRR